MICQCNEQKNGVATIEKDQRWDEVIKIVDYYRAVDGSLIAILQKIQEIYNYIPRESIELIAQVTGIKQAKILGVVSFYTQFRTEPIGKHLIMLCKGTACHVNGAGEIEEAIAEALGIGDGETTDDKLFTLMNVACLGCCSLSPVMMIGDDTFGTLTPEKAKKILKNIKEREVE